MAAVATTTGIDSLPTEDLCNIFSYLSPDGLVVTAQVNRRWHQLVPNFVATRRSDRLRMLTNRVDTYLEQQGEQVRIGAITRVGIQNILQAHGLNGIATASNALFNDLIEELRKLSDAHLETLDQKIQDLQFALPLEAMFKGAKILRNPPHPTNPLDTQFSLWSCEFADIGCMEKAREIANELPTPEKRIREFHRHVNHSRFGKCFFQSAIWRLRLPPGKLCAEDQEGECHHLSLQFACNGERRLALRLADHILDEDLRMRTYRLALEHLIKSGDLDSCQALVDTRLPTDNDGLFHMMIAFADAGDIEKALTFAERSPAGRPLYSILADHIQKRGQLEKAREIVLQDPPGAYRDNVIKDLLGLYLKNDRLEGLDSLLDAIPETRDLQIERIAYNLMRKGRFDDARTWASKLSDPLAREKQLEGITAYERDDGDGTDSA